ncbi:hypothetical protein J1N35_018940 [Gossypium stocksii]|uniref:Uncharacterized protein n=1 Tax=Gossypium stocksii TaxID=47602 RepID=A0A9D3VS52_9ROSI|nr:hypothetical protein J1N35_018940 [Gossypium stocksii]
MFPDSDIPIAKSAWSEFEDEKLYISELLRDLERKVSKFAHHGTLPHISDRERLDEAANRGQHQQESLDESALSQELSNTSVSEDQVDSKGNGHMVSNGQKGFENCNETSLASVENEISDLNEKLEVLLADYKFLENSSFSSSSSPSTSLYASFFFFCSSLISLQPLLTPEREGKLTASWTVLDVVTCHVTLL